MFFKKYFEWDEINIIAFLATKYAFLLNNMRVEYTQSGKTS